MFNKLLESAPMAPADRDITVLLDAARAGDGTAWHRLVELVYPELKRLARSSLNANRHNTLNTTALVHECYLRLARAENTPKDRGHLLSLAVRIMRQVLIDHARERLAQKRGGGAIAVTLDDDAAIELQQFELLVEIDSALQRLAAIEPRQAAVFEHRYFGGLNDDDTAAALEISPRTVHRDWDAARAWLAEALNAGA
ncbi:RNA polymerase sigma factor, TIGR02999 family [Aquimonas voraii]|uniref:RNA polymerase sigma factor, TIGR02999 family n=2 Tax=Aquimonas voraii TaxID=265719 RepID=A0A1G6X595_9GAMM|nr:RNA polymerase sigma factor, TIGR02999 family [Aquimonas voraii]